MLSHYTKLIFTLPGKALIISLFEGQTVLDLEPLNISSYASKASFKCHDPDGVASSNLKHKSNAGECAN